MLSLLGRRARAQWPLLVSLLAVLMVGATLLGICVLLVTRTSDRAVEVAASHIAPDDRDVTAFDVQVSPADARSVAADTRTVLSSAIAPFPATVSTRVSSVMRDLPFVKKGDGGYGGEGYLSGIEGLQSKATLVEGHWPEPGGPLQSVVLEKTADLLGLKVGQRVRLGEELTRDPAPAVTVTVVGIIRARPDTGWDRDVLEGAGYDSDPEDNTQERPLHAYGPFVVDLDTLLATRSAMARIEVTARPDLAGPTGDQLDTLTTSLLAADRKLAGTLGGRVQIERVSSPLPQALLGARSQEELTSGVVLAVALIGVVLTAIALALAGRLTTGVRGEESDLLSALGTGRGQFAAAAVTEAGALALVAAVLSVPASSALHSVLTHLPPLSGAGLTTAPAVTPAQVLTVAGGALALAIVLVVLAVRPAAPSGDRRTRRELLARSGADLLLVALAAVGWWQLRSQPGAAGSRADAVRILAPALLLTAGTALTLRLVPPVLGVAERLAARARGIVAPLAAFGAARRPQAVAAGLLIGLACATATFGTAFSSTWHASQRAQADLSVGTDVDLSLTAAPAAGQGAAVGTATGSSSVSPVVRQGIAVGQWLGGNGAAPQLVAVDTTHAGGLLRGRLDGDRSWADVGAELAPEDTAAGFALTRGGTATVTGTATGTTPVFVTPRLVLQDASGLRTSCTGASVRLDARPHAVKGCVTAPGERLVAVYLPITSNDGVYAVGTSNVAVTLAVPATGGSASAWSARPAAASPEEGPQLTAPAATASGTRLKLGATVQFGYDADEDRVLVATAFPDPGPLPVAISAGLAADVSAHRGSKLSLTVGTTPVDAKVVDVVSDVPSAPGAGALLADVDTLTRALIVHGEADSPVTDWWAGNPAQAAAGSRVGALSLGTVTTRAGETARLTGSPLRSALPAVLRLLVVAAIVLLIGGVVLHVTCDLQLRALEVARLRGLGMSRRDIRAALLGEHAGVLLPVLVAGAAVGALATWLVAPLLIRSDTGAAPVPSASAHWPWGPEAAIVAVLVLGTALTVAAVVTVQARRADAAHLRVAS